MEDDKKNYDCIIVGAGPGGLQAAIYLGRYNRSVLLLDRGGGRTAHARSIENFLSHKTITGKEMIELGKEQARAVNVAVEKGLVASIARSGDFIVSTKETSYRARFVLVGTGITDTLPPLENLPRFFGTSFFTCIDCDGYRLRDKNTVVMGDSIETVRLALAVRELYSDHITLVLTGGADLPEDYQEELREQGIPLIRQAPAKLIGTDMLSAVELADGKRIAAEAVLSNYGFTRNDAFLAGLPLKRSATGSIIVNRHCESSLVGLYVVGPLNTGHDQAVIAAGQGAVAAIDINKSLFAF